MRRSAVVGWTLCVAALALTALASFGTSARRVTLNLGPGDRPFVHGFEPNSEVKDKVGWHWTTYAATIDLPLQTPQSEVAVTLRFARVFGEEALVNVRVAGVPAEPFRARGGDVKTTALPAIRVSGQMAVSIDVDSHERRNMGLKMDRVALDVVAGARLKLQSMAALRPVLAVILLIVGLVVLGATPLATGLITSICAVAFGAGCLHAVFLAWRVTRLAPLMIVLSTVVLWGGKQWMQGRTRMDAGVATWLSGAALVTMLFRLTLVSHPDFYYPDLLTHARVAEAIRSEGASFFLHPAAALSAQGAWTKPVLGSVSSLPYAVMFHAPFAAMAAVFDLDADQIETAMKAVSCLISVLPILLAGCIASRLSLPPLAALGLCLSPTYASRLSFALLPALFGHVFDLIAILALIALVDDSAATSMKAAIRAALALMFGHLAYTSSVVNESLFVAVMATLCLLHGSPGFRRGRFLVLAEGVAASLAFALYYRFFVGDLFGLVSRLIGGGVGASATGASSVYPIESFWALLAERSVTFFGPLMVLAIAGLVWSGPAVWKSIALQAWVVTYLALIFLRAKIPDVFRYGHETLFLTPLVALLAAACFILVWRRGGRERFAAALLGLGVAVALLAMQRDAVVEQFKNAL